MECALVSRLPEGPEWTYEVKFDGYRTIGVKTSREALLYSRNGKNFNKRYSYLAEALVELPTDTVINGEIVALDHSGRPDFHRLQHFGAEAPRIHYFVFDLLVSNGRDLTKLALSERRNVLAALNLRSPRIRISEQFDIPAADMVSAVRQQQLEGVAAKRKSSLYEAGKRTGSWAKMRLNRGQEFVIGGFIPGPHGVDSIINPYRYSSWRGRVMFCRFRSVQPFFETARKRESSRDNQRASTSSHI
jgi:ATP-dependent DNA ligase